MPRAARGAERAALFSTVLMWLLAELFEESKAFVDSITQTVRLIRSKGAGAYFVTQMPKDVDDDVLAQLGDRVQPALRAFTPDDAKALEATVRTFPNSEFDDLEQLLPSRLRTGRRPRPPAAPARSASSGC